MYQVEANSGPFFEQKTVPIPVLCQMVSEEEVTSDMERK